MAKDISLNILPADACLEDVLMTLNSGVFGVVFISDEDNRIVGLFTDGDVRRAMLDGAGLEKLLQDGTGLIGGDAQSGDEVAVVDNPGRSDGVPLPGEMVQDGPLDLLLAQPGLQLADALFQFFICGFSCHGKPPIGRQGGSIPATLSHSLQRRC